MRAAWFCILLIAAGLSVVTALDRSSAQNPALAPLVPGAFRSAGLPTVTTISLATDDPSVALDNARTLVRRKPAPAESLYLLSLAQLRAGDTDAYARTFEEATTRGWRTVPLQIAAANAAIGRGEAGPAALRVAAIWAVERGNPALDQLSSRLMGLPGGPEAFGGTMARMRIRPVELVVLLGRSASGDQLSRAVAAARREGMEFASADIANALALAERRTVPAQAQ